MKRTQAGRFHNAAVPLLLIASFTLTCPLYAGSGIIIPSATATPHQIDVALITINWTSGGQIELDSALYVRIDATLSLARTVNDTLDDIHAYQNYYLDRLSITWTDGEPPASWVNGELESGDAYIDSLGTALGLTEVVQDEDDDKKFTLFYDRLMNVENAAYVYRNSGTVSAFGVWTWEFESTTLFTDIDLRMYADQMCYAFEWEDITHYIEEEGDYDQIWWYVSVDGSTVSYDGRVHGVPHDIAFYNQPMHYNFNDVYQDIDSLLSDLSQDALWWHREYALYATLFYFPGFFYYFPGDDLSPGRPATALETLMERLPELPNGMKATEHLREIQSTASTSEERPTRGLEHLLALYAEDVTAAIAADTTDPDSMQSALATFVYSYYSEYLETRDPYVQPYPFHLWAPDSTYRHTWVDTLEWEWAYEADSADYFDYLVGVFGSEPNLQDTIGVLRTDSTLVTLQNLQATYELSRNVSYTIEIKAERNATGDIVSGGYYGFNVTDYGPAKPFAIQEPLDGALIPASTLDQFTLRWTSAGYPGWPSSPFYSAIIVRPDNSILELGGFTVDTSLVMDIQSSLYPDSSGEGELPVSVTVYSYHTDVYNASGPFGSSGWANVDVTIDFSEAVGEKDAELPQAFKLSSTYPNPFNPSATVVVGMPQRARLKLEVFNLLGQRVAVLSDGVVPQGWRSFVFDGSRLASGIYLVRATVPGKLEQTRRITLVR